MNKIVVITFLICFSTIQLQAQIKINNKTDIKIGGNKPSSSKSNAVVKTKSGEKLSKSAGYYYESYEKHLSNKKYEDAKMALKKVQQKSEEEVDLTAEYDEIRALSGEVEKINLSSEQEDIARIERGNDKTVENQRKALEEKYSEIRYNLAKVQKIFNRSSGIDLKEIKEGLAYFREKSLTLNKIQQMVDDPEEEKLITEVGTVNARIKVKNSLLPSFSAVLSNNSEDFNLEKISQGVDDSKTHAAKALQANQFAAENAQKVEEWADLMTQLFAFTNSPQSLNLYMSKTDKVLQDLKQSQNEIFGDYRSGEFHKAKGSGIYLVQKDGITPTTLSSKDVTEKIIIDGVSPVHIFVLTDRNIDGYGVNMHFDISDGKNGMNQNKYVFDANRAVPVRVSEKGQGYKKLVLVPSENWGDMNECYSKCQFYSCFIQETLAKELVPNTPQEFTFYAIGGQLRKTVTIEATEKGIEFLNSMKQKMEKFEIDAARMETAEGKDHDLEVKIKQKFRESNSNVNEIKRIVLTSEPWFIKKDAWGNIENKNCYAQLAYKDEDGNYYIQNVYCTQKYEGGKYQPLKVTNRFEPRRIRQENIMK